MSSKQCSQCGLVNWSTAEACKRCGSLFEVQDTPEELVQQEPLEQQDPREGWEQNFEILEPIEPDLNHIFSGGVKFLTGILAVEAVFVVLSFLHVIEGDTAGWIAVAFIWGGILLSVLTHIWLVIRIFEQSVWWGLGTLCIPLVGLIAVAQFWQKTKRSFIGRLICIGIAVFGFLIVPESFWQQR